MAKRSSTNGAGGSGPDATDRIEYVLLSQETRRRYLNYAMSVIMSRALPDVRDGLKPVQRRILFAMYRDLRLTADSKTLKCAKISGQTMGDYHPHGEGAIYDALVRMAQNFMLRYPLVHGQGNFGSIMGLPAAASRYTEAKLTAVAEHLIEEMKFDTVEMRPNYDGRERTEPTTSSCQPSVSQSAGERRVWHRGRHGDEYAAAQSERSDRRLYRADRKPGRGNERPAQVCEGPGLSAGRPDDYRPKSTWRAIYEEVGGKVRSKFAANGCHGKARKARSRKSRRDLFPSRTELETGTLVAEIGAIVNFSASCHNCSIQTTKRTTSTPCESCSN